MEEYDLPLPDLSVDRIVLVHALEMSDDAPSLVREIWRVLAPGGRLLLVIPNRRGLWARQKTARAMCWCVFLIFGQPGNSPRRLSAPASSSGVPVTSNHFLYYNFVRIHKTLQTTPAMAAGVTKRLWEIKTCSTRGK